MGAHWEIVSLRDSFPLFRVLPTLTFLFLFMSSLSNRFELLRFLNLFLCNVTLLKEYSRAIDFSHQSWGKPVLETCQVADALILVLGWREYGELPKGRVSFCADGDRGTTEWMSCLPWWGEDLCPFYFGTTCQSSWNVTHVLSGLPRGSWGFLSPLVMTTGIRSFPYPPILDYAPRETGQLQNHSYC